MSDRFRYDVFDSDERQQIGAGLDRTRLLALLVGLGWPQEKAAEMVERAEKNQPGWPTASEIGGYVIDVKERFFKLIVSYDQLGLIETALRTLSAGDEDSEAENTAALNALGTAEEVL